MGNVLGESFGAKPPFDQSLAPRQGSASSLAPPLVLQKGGERAGAQGVGAELSSLGREALL